MSGFNTVAVILTMGMITLALRAAPFISLKLLKDNPFLGYIGRKMPVGVMTLLVIYTFKSGNFTVFPFGVPLIASSLIVLALYWKTKNPLLSVFTALAFHLIAVNFPYLSGLFQGP